MKRLLAIALLLYSSSAFAQVEYSTIEDITKLIAQGGDSALLLFRRAEIHHNNKKDSSALADINMIRASDQNLLYAGNRLKVDVLANLQRIDEAIKLAEDLVKINPTDAELRFKLANMLQYTNNVGGALVQYNWLIENFPNEPIGYAMRATMMMRMRNADGVRSDLARLDQFSKDSLRSDALEQASMLHNAIGNFNEGKIYAESVLRRDTTAAALALKGWSLWGLKVYRDAIALFDKSIAITPQPNAYLFRGKSYFALKFYTKAEIDLKKCLEMDPNSEDAYAFLGYVYQKRGNMKAACDCWKKGLNIYPKSDLTHDVEVYCK